jgi:SAM-dependent methyltransferase
MPAAPADVLDAACGPGLYAVRLARLGYDVTGIDVGDAVLRHARTLARDARVPVTLRRADLRTLDMREQFDCVLLVYFILEGFRRAQQVIVLRRLAAALRPGGRLIAELRVRPDQPAGRLSAWEHVPFSILGDRRHLLLTDATYDDSTHTYVLREIAVFDDRVAVQQTTGAFTPLSDVAPLFARAGLEVTAIYDGWSRFRATGLSHSLLVVADKPTTKPRVRQRRRSTA